MEIERLIFFVGKNFVREIVLRLFLRLVINIDNILGVLNICKFVLFYRLRVNLYVEDNFI